MAYDGDFKSIDEYIAAFPKDVQRLMEKLRTAIKEQAPQATEAISYQMPNFKLKGNLVHFAAYKKHIGFYPTPSAIEAFKEKLSGYKTSKGAVQFPIDESLPIDLIKDMVRYRVKENLAKKKDHA
jgi:uncharacterized protein YdhG (YjbR/CyaY superfamily)